MIIIVLIKSIIAVSAGAVAVASFFWWVLKTYATKKNVSIEKNDRSSIILFAKKFLKKEPGLSIIFFIAFILIVLQKSDVLFITREGVYFLEFIAILALSLPILVYWLQNSKEH